MQVSPNKIVSIDYTLTDDDGQVLDSSAGDPLTYLHGVGGLIVGLERALDGHRVGDRFQVAIPPEDAYGERDDALVHAVPREQFGDLDDLEIGMQLELTDENGDHARLVTVVDMDEDTVTLDGNHELAGMRLNFDIEVTGIREATPEELEHGHAHGCGCHH